MNPLAWLLGLLLPACGGFGADRVAAPRPLDIAHFDRPSTPNTALAAPVGTGIRPDIVVPEYPVPASRLLAAIERVAGSEPRTWRLDPAGDTGQTARYVVRSAIWNFPDIVSVEVLPRRADASTFALYSRSVYGRSDFGINLRRITAWIAALNATLKAER